MQGIRSALDLDVSGVYQLGSGQPTSLNTLLEEIRLVTGTSHSFKVHYEDFRAGEIQHTWCDISKARSELGFSTNTQLSDGLRKTWDWFLSAAP